jgi:hypothetical protein
MKKLGPYLHEWRQESPDNVEQEDLTILFGAGT